MFRHQGKSRTLKHNLQIATILSLVAGMVNVAGFLAFRQLTTNVTGHFAFFIGDVADFEIVKGTIFFFYIISFFVGSFLTSFLIENYRESKKLNVFVLPTLIEVSVLIAVGVASNFMVFRYPNLIVCALLFAMGVQNSFVTKISSAVVRTTHLTGLFTDLGIDVSHLFFRRLHFKREKIKANIKLRLYIISFFFMGGIVGRFLYATVNWKLNTLLVASAILLVSLFFDDFRYKIIKAKRRFSHLNQIVRKRSTA